MTPYFYTICYGDTDAGGVVYFATYLRLCERAWTAYLDAQGWNLAAKAKEGVVLTVKRVEADYLSPARYGTTVAITTRIEEASRASFWFHHEIRESASGTLFARIRAQMVAVRPTGKILRLPDALREIIERRQDIPSTVGDA